MHLYASGLLLLSLCSSLGAQENAAEWIAKLGSPSFEERQQAVRQLENLGAAALEPLRSALHVADLETRRRVEGVLPKIEASVLLRTFTEKSTRTRRLVATDANGATLAKLLSEAYPGVTFSQSLPAEKHWSFDTGELPYWQALAEFGRQTGLIAFWNNNSEWGALTFAKRGLFLALEERMAEPSPRWANRSSKLWLSACPAKNYADGSLQFSAVADPSIPHYFEWHALKIDSLTDAQGSALPFKGLPVQWTREPSKQSIEKFEISGPMLVQMAFPWSAQNLKFHEVAGRATFKVALDRVVVSAPAIFTGEGKTYVGKHDVRLTLDAVDDRDDEAMWVELRVKNLASILPTPDEPEVVRLRPGVVVMRGLTDYAGDTIKLRNKEGRYYDVRLPKQPRESNGEFSFVVQFMIPRAERAGAELVVALRRWSYVDIPFRLEKE